MYVATNTLSHNVAIIDTYIATMRYIQLDEQLVMERMGHHSIDGIHLYNRTTYFQRENVSDILNCNASKRVCTVSMPLHMVSKHAGIESPNTMKNLVSRTHNFHSCANVTFNTQYGPTCTSNAQSINEH